MEVYCIDKQKAFRRDCIYNIENTDLEIGVLGIFLHLLFYFDKQIFQPLRVMHQPFEIE